MKLLIASALLLLTFSVYSDETDYRVGYIVGGHKMKAALARQGREIRDEVKAKLRPRLLFFAGAAVTITLCGPELAEVARRRLKGIFKIGKRMELALAWLGYLTVTAGIMIYGIAVYGAGESVPLAILLAGTVWPFAEVLRGIMNDDRALRKTGFGRIKTLWFLCLVVIMVYRLLSDKGFGNIKVG